LPEAERFAMSSVMTRGLFAAALAAALCVSTAAAQDGGGSPLSVLDRMFGQRPQAPVPQGQGQQGRGQQTTGQDDSLPDQVLRIERLEAQIRQMTGTIEQLQYRNQQLEGQVRAMGGTAGTQPGQPTLQPGPSAQAGQALPPVQQPRATQTTPAPASSLPLSTGPGRRSDVFDPTQNPNAPGAPHTLGSLSSSGVAVEPPPVIEAETPVGAPGGRGAGAPLDLSTMATGAGGGGGESGYPQPGYPQQGGALPAPPSRNLSATGAVASVGPPTDQPKDYYDLGYGYVLRKDYALAEQTFDTFLKKFPGDRRAADAQFWLGESLFQRQRYDAAAQSFLELSTKYGTHAKAPDALLRLGQSLAALKQKEMACATFAEIGRKYPRASANVKQGVEREQKRVQC
jgi:tol-pal system protein YbgF